MADLQLARINLPAEQELKLYSKSYSLHSSLSLKDHSVFSNIFNKMSSSHLKKGPHVNRKKIMERVFQRPTNLSLQKLKQKYGLERPHLISSGNFSSTSSVILGKSKAQINRGTEYSGFGKNQMPSIPQLRRNQSHLFHRRVQSMNIYSSEKPIQAMCQSYQFTSKPHNQKQFKRMPKMPKNDKLSNKYRMRPPERITFKPMPRNSHRRSQLQRISINSWRVGQEGLDQDAF